MEPAVIDWKRVDSRYVRDEAYENINAPMWLDLASPNDGPVDDTAWFCRPDCKHPKTAEDFKLSVTPSPKAKLMRSSSERLPFGERNSNRRDENNLKRRAGIVAAPHLLASPVKPKTAASKVSKVDLENQDPKQSTPKTRNPVKEMIKSSAKKEVEEKREEPKHKKVQPRLKSTMSARNLFSGKDIMSQISEFYRELKRMAVGSRTPPVGEETKEEVKNAAQNLHKPEADDTKLLIPNVNDKSPHKRVKPKIEVRANPPTPQRFPSPRSAKNPKAIPNGRSPLNKPPKSTTMGRAILQDREEKKALLALKDEGNSEAASADLFWFLKPCNHVE